MAMTRSGLVERVAKKGKISALQAELVVETIFDSMKKAAQIPSDGTPRVDSGGKEGARPR
jgi:hypothetical protein